MASSPSEHEIQQRIRLACGRGAGRLWRNNTGALVDQQGRFVRFGLCKANGKRWKDYRESDRCQHYLDALESVAGISVHALVESRSGGAGGGGTWVHPQVAVDLARWISAPFAVWMDGWFLESVQQAPPAKAAGGTHPG